MTDMFENQVTTTGMRALLDGSRGMAGDASGGLGGSRNWPVLLVGGRDFNTRFPDGTRENVATHDKKFGLHCDVVVVAINPGLSKKFWRGAYSKDASTPPDCSSAGGLVPDEWVAEPVNPTCRSCINNQFGSRITEQGKRGKACSDSKRVAVKLYSDLDGPIYELQVSATAIKDFRDVCVKIESHGYSVPSAVLRLYFDPEASYPKLMFHALSLVTEVDIPKIHPAINSIGAKICVGIPAQPHTPKVISQQHDVPATLPSSPEERAKLSKAALANVLDGVADDRGPSNAA